MVDHIKLKELTLEDLVKKINSKGKDYLSIEVMFELLFKITKLYFDYYESDMGEYLIIRSSKKYHFYIYLRITFILGYLITLSLFVFLKAFPLRLIFGISALLTFFIYIYLDEIINHKFQYTTTFFQSIRKKLIFFKNKLILLLNNSYITDGYTSPNYDFELIKGESIQLKNRIETINEILKPYSYYLKKFALPSILFTPAITFFINLIYYCIQNPIMISLDTIIDFIIGFFFLITLLYNNLSAINRMKKSRKSERASIYNFYGILIQSILEALRLRLRILQFPKEEKIKGTFQLASKEILEKLNKNFF